MRRSSKLVPLIIAMTATACLYPSLKTITETGGAAGDSMAIDSGPAGAGGNAWVHDAPVVSAKLSLKFCHKFAEIRSLKLHA